MVCTAAIESKLGQAGIARNGTMETPNHLYGKKLEILLFEALPLPGDPLPGLGRDLESDGPRCHLSNGGPSQGYSGEPL